MKFHGRMSPGVIGPDEVVTLEIHSPAKASGVKLKIWELDTFVDRKGKAVREGSKDDLLAELDGEIAPGPGRQGAADWRIFKLASKKVTSDAKELIAFRLKIAGVDELLRIPVVSEEKEAEERTFELGFSIEVGGAEKFKTKSPCLLRPKVVFPVFAVSLKGAGGSAFLPPEGAGHPLSHHHVCIGVARGEGPEGRLEILEQGWIDGYGVLVDQRPGGKQKPQPVGVRAGRPLWAYVHREADAALAPGLSRIPIALCEPIPPDGAVTIEMLDMADLLSLHIVELPAKPTRTGNGPLAEIDLSGFGKGDRELDPLIDGQRQRLRAATARLKGSKA